VAVSRAERRRDRELRVVAVFGPDHATRVLDLLELVELAWHDCVGSIEKLIGAARLAVTDWRDLKVAADARRARP